MAGIYIHIPFCKSRCIYCDFFSTTSVALIDRYVQCLCHEMDLRANYLAHADISTIYLGGGTPSLLNEEQLQRIFSYINKVYDVNWNRSDLEVTIECNPDDVTPAFATMLTRLPINRISMGVQTFDDQLLRFLHRRHNAHQARQAFHLLRHAGFNNISLDLMFGFPQQTLEQWIADIHQALQLQPEHLSAYSLMYEEDTPLWHLLQDKKIEEISDELSVSMYNALVDALTRHGYEHYEIINFAHPGYASRHNSSYWQATPYLGLGAAAHSYNIDSRQWNIAHLQSYMEGIENNQLNAEKEILDDTTKYNDMITTALRTSQGIRLSDLRPPYHDYLLAQAQPHLAQHLLTLSHDHLRLTREGIMVSNQVMSELIYV